MLKPIRPDLSQAHAIINARSGKAEGARMVEDLTAAVSAAGGALTVHLDRKSGRIETLTRKALDKGATTVIAAGGDGTISGVAGEMVGSGVPMGVVPMGTFNYFARALGVPETPAEAIRAVTDGVIQPAAVGRINDKVFLNNTSIGIYSAILKEREETYARFGRSRIAAYWSVLRALIKFYDPMTMSITVDGKQLSVRSPLAFVGHSAYQLERFDLEGAEAVRDGKLALFLADDVGRRGLVRHAFRLATRRMQAGRDFRLVTGSEIVIDPGRHKRLVVRDGEKAPMRGPYRISIEHGALDVIRPKDVPTDDPEVQ
ncbi:diacylglycerol/lipid kinase family protein [Maritimibacter dapengensis]|uniref:NAD(+)/NADH kinase n=1 Tax=Maritimibacter dapengensis TaxID=2836868 RepID=A0ABS6SYX0_9RHOB|nr:diacylglycerol kinase family protein [Maritimibacter dapengensis]MBV7377733.1 NAD(+)/NADH kinase [Maritimibacter dapengensis]